MIEFLGKGSLHREEQGAAQARRWSQVKPTATIPVDFRAIEARNQPMMDQAATPMGSVQTLAQRKQARVEEIRAGVASLREALAAYGRAHGGRFLIYGSAVSDRLHYDSDVDLLVDFPAPATSAAVDFVEETCARLNLRVDVQPKTWCKEAFLARIIPQAQVVP